MFYSKNTSLFPQCKLSLFWLKYFLSLLDNKLLTFNDKLFQNTFSCWCSGYHISLKLIDKASNQKIASSILVEVEHFDPYTGCASIVCVGDCY